MTAPEWSRPVRLTREPRVVAIEANAGERAALAARFGIPAIHALSARLDLVPEPGGSVRARGALEATVEQCCVVTLDPVVQPVSAPLDLRILEDGAEPADNDPSSPDEIESRGGIVDLGEAVAEQLALALDPYPRADGAALPALDEGEAASEQAPERPNPFAKLGKPR
jgi:uncharacterized metal-binding protein YceD (DUF177 family)